MEKDAKLLADKTTKGKAKSIRVFYDYLMQEDHSTVTHQAVLNAFRMLHLKNTEFPKALTDQLLKSNKVKD